MSDTTELPADIQAEIKELKARGCRVMRVVVQGSQFVYRSLNRKEFRDLQKQILDKQDRDESAVSEGQDLVVAKALVHPKVLSSLELSGLPAGVVVQLYELVMQASGFGAEEVVPEQL